MDSITFPLTVKIKSLKLLFMKLLWFASTIYILISIFFIDDRLHSEISGALFLSTTALCIISNHVFKKYKVVGSINFGIKTITVNKDLIFNVNKMSDVKVRYIGYAGEPYGVFIATLSVKNGAENTISFIYENTPHEFSFYLENKGGAYFLYGLMKEWREVGVEWELYNYYGRKTEKIE